MDTDELREAISAITPVDEREATSIAATLERLDWSVDLFDEEADPHHLTASAFVVSRRGVILHLHRKLSIWVQTGGHVDAGESPAAAALRETVEPLEATVRDIKERAQPLVSRRGELQATIAELEATLNEEIAALQANRVSCHEAVADPWRSRYDAAMTRVGVSGAAFVESGRCDGCRIALAPLDLDRFKHRAEGDVMECPECGRILLG